MAKPRIPPAPPAASAFALDVESRILQTRGTISPLYQILLNSPALAAGWERLLTAVRQELELDPALRELVILRIAVLNSAPYEFEAHTSFAARAGVSPEAIGAVRGEDRSLFSARESLALTYCDAMTRDVVVPDDIFTQLRATFDEKGIVELTATIAAYNMVSRFLAALDVH